MGLVQSPRHKYNGVVQHLASMGYSCVLDRFHFIDNLLGGVYLNNLSSTDLFILDIASSAKNDVNIHTKFDGAWPKKIRLEIWSIFPVKWESCPSELGKHSLALELASDYCNSILTHQAGVLVRGTNNWNLFDCILHRQKAVSRLLNADVSPALCTKIIISKQDKFFIEQAEGSANPSELGNGCDCQRAFLRARENLDLAPFCDN